jgi:hypothetical protein
MAVCIRYHSPYLGNKCYSATYATDDSQKALNLKMKTYVDDVNTHQTNTEESNNIEYNMQHDYNKWKSLLVASGGQLASEKFNYYISQWTFQDNGKLKMELARATQHKDSISEVINAIQSLHQSLGINISPVNLAITQQNQWIDKDKHTLNILKTNKMSDKEAEVLYKTIYNPQIQYLLLFFSVPKKDLQQITKCTALQHHKLQTPHDKLIWLKISGSSW